MKSSRPVQTLIIANPAAGSRRALRAATALAALLPDAALVPTEAPGHATELARQARKRGVQTVVAVGGDGTLQEVVTGLCLDSSGEPLAPNGDTKLALLPSGTGGDYKRTHFLTDSVEQAATRIRLQEAIPLDIGRAQFEGLNGAPIALAFANVLSFGLGGLTDRLVETSPKWIGGRAAFFLGAARATLLYTPVPIELVVDGSPLEVAPYSNVAICLGRYFGGGMKIAPDADPSDGWFDIVTIEATRMQTLSLTADIYKGTHARHPYVTTLRGRNIRARPTRSAEVLVDADGQQPGQLPLSVDLLPRAIDFLV